MLRVKTRIAPSSIHGLGLYAAQDIREGQTIWEYDEGFDLSMPLEKLDSIPEIPRAQLKMYMYHSKDTGLYVLCADGARFMNHSPHPNTRCTESDQAEDKTVAAVDIPEGTELTCNYEDFDATWKEVTHLRR